MTEREPDEPQADDEAQATPDEADQGQAEDADEAAEAAEGHS